jgi:hypothetical protein
MASPERSDSLKRAIRSIRLSSNEPVDIIVVVNGTRFDKAVCDWLKDQPDVIYFYQEIASQIEAIKAGRNLIATEYFSFLDDDDEYLCGATDQKLLKLKENFASDFVVANALRHQFGADTRIYSRMERVEHDPLGKLMEFAWLNSGNALFRTSSVGPDCFDDLPAYAEWTWLAFRMVLTGKALCVLDVPVVRIYDTPASLSKTSAYVLAYVSLFKQMLAIGVPRRIKKLIKKKLCNAYHDASTLALQEDRFLWAWIFHLRSLTHLNGWKYLSYSRHLLGRSRRH